MSVLSRRQLLLVRLSNDNTGKHSVMGGGRRNENYFHCIAARHWDHAQAERLKYTVKGE